MRASNSSMRTLVSESAWSNSMLILRSWAISRAAARLSRRRAIAPEICWIRRKAKPPDRIATGQPGKRAMAADRVAAANRNVRVMSALVISGPEAAITGRFCPDADFQTLNHRNDAKAGFARVALGFC